MSAPDRDQMLARIRALLAKTEEAGCTEAEAHSAAAKAAELIEKYRVTAHELGAESARHSANFGSSGVESGAGPRAPFHWAVLLANAVSKLVMCPSYVSPAHRAIFFIGEDLQRELGVRLYASLRDRCLALEREAFKLIPKPLRPDWRKFSYSYREGFAHGFEDVARAEKARRDASPNARLTSELVRDDTARADDWIRQTTGRSPDQKRIKNDGVLDYSHFLKGLSDGRAAPTTAPGGSLS